MEFEVIIHFEKGVTELGQYDVDHISKITLLHALNETVTGCKDVPQDDYLVYALLPWCEEKMLIKDDREMLKVFNMFTERSCRRIVFEIDKKPYISLPLEGSSCRPNDNPLEVLASDYEPLEFSNLGDVEVNYLGDNENEIDMSDLGHDEFGIGRAPSVNEVESSGFPNINMNDIDEVCSSENQRALAVAICEAENNLSWEWFLGHLKHFLDFPNDKPLTFMSDRQKGVINGLEKQWPNASIRFCARHIHANFRLKYPGMKLKQLFWKASRSANIHEFNNAMKEIEGVNERAKNWLDQIKPEFWSRHAFDTSIKCDHVTNNMTESFNNMLGDHRAKTYLELLEYIRRMVMKRFQQRKNEAIDWTSELPPNVHKKIVMESKMSRCLQMLSAGNGEYELLGTTRAYVAKLNESTCECGMWQISGVPCSHALAGITHSCQMSSVTQRLLDFVHPSLTKSAFLRTYASMIHPIPDQCQWCNIDAQPLLPPPVMAKPGRPRVKRIREPDERPRETRSNTVVCKKCQLPGHNKRSCRGKSVTTTSQTAKGRDKQNLVASESKKNKDAPTSQAAAKKQKVGSSSQPTTQPPSSQPTTQSLSSQPTIQPSSSHPASQTH